MFPVIILIFYTIISYSMVFLYLITLNSLVADSARSAVSIFTASGVEREAVVTSRIQGIIDNSWFPSGAISGCYSNGTQFNVDQSDLLSVCLAADLPMAQLNILGFRIPAVPDPLTASAAVQLAPLP